MSSSAPPKKMVETQQHDARFIESRFQETRESRVPIAPFYFHGSHYFTLPRQGQSLATGPGPPAVLRTPRTALKICRPEMDWKQKCVQLPSLDRQSANLASFCWRISWKTYLCVWQISWVQASTNERPAGKSSAIGGVNLVLYFSRKWFKPGRPSLGNSVTVWDVGPWARDGATERSDITALFSSLVSWAASFVTCFTHVSLIWCDAEGQRFRAREIILTPASSLIASVMIMVVIIGCHQSGTVDLFICVTPGSISMWLLFFVTAEWQWWWAIVSRAAQCLWADHSWSSYLKAANGDLTTRISQGCMMVFERSILSILSCSRIVKHQLVLREFPSNSTNVSNSPWESALYCFILGSFNWSGLGAAILSHIRSNHFILTFTNVLSDAC